MEQFLKAYYMCNGYSPRKGKHEKHLKKKNDENISLQIMKLDKSQTQETYFFSVMLSYAKMKELRAKIFTITNIKENPPIKGKRLLYAKVYIQKRKNNGNGYCVGINITCLTYYLNLCIIA